MLYMMESNQKQTKRLKHQEGISQILKNEGLPSLLVMSD